MEISADFVFGCTRNVEVLMDNEIVTEHVPELSFKWVFSYHKFSNQLVAVYFDTNLILLVDFLRPTVNDLVLYDNMQ